MDFQARLEALTHQLRPWSPLWSRSILQGWPGSGAAFPEDWLAYARSLDEAGERQLDQGVLVGAPPPSLAALVGALQELTALPWHQGAHPLTVAQTQGLSVKKTHELERVLALLAPRTRFIQQAVDIGGGMGHLARLCARTFGWTFHSIDRDAALQDKGRRWLGRTPSPGEDTLSFIEASVEDGPQPRIDPLFSGRDRASIGLHTCGPLALTQLRKSQGAGFVLNIGCCYDKLEAPRDFPVSRFGGAHPLPFTPHALALTTRGRHHKTEVEFARMKQVYAWRFAFHLLSRQRFPERGFVRAGDAPRALYAGRFAAYARDRLERLCLDANMTDAELEAFEVSVRAETRDLLLCHLLRDRFARALEVVLLLDRALLLEELGFQVEFLQLFDPRLSPRNLALIASRSA
ncbi:MULTISPECIES: methyltransferase [Corallococcus]|uniref:methyltransferase n=1 Tax=Corallococcus TaxID=83461 RepID=UPI000EA072C8|nr:MULTISPECIES: methyltransferase [Corallococcus]NRD57376.1 methyltransferase [Corallococcus exiguus]RKH17886.1 methyltransferase [Corallococcus sp. CA041A]